MKYLDIQHDLVNKYRIKLDPYSSCWRRTHAHIRERRVCKFDYKSSFRATFTLAHEIGHIETTKANMKRCESEYYATQWAIDRLEEYGLDIDENVVALYQDYINEEYERGLRRHCKTLPPLERLQLKCKNLKITA